MEDLVAKETDACRWWEVKRKTLIYDLFSPFYWAGFVAQRERAKQDFKVPYKVPHLTHPPFTYERQP